MVVMAVVVVLVKVFSDTYTGSDGGGKCGGVSIKFLILFVWWWCPD
jgi:hypothetical protein